MQELIQANTDWLKQLSSSNSEACYCGLETCAGWKSRIESRWPAEQMQAMATLQSADAPEPTYKERHPQGTPYESSLAPVAAKFVPYNGLNIYQCSSCTRYLLRYTAYGGYYVVHRVRCLNGVSISVV